MSFSDYVYSKFLPHLMLGGSRQSFSCWTMSTDFPLAKGPGTSSKFYHSFFCCFFFVQLLSLTLCNPMDCSTSGFPVLHCLLEFAQIQVHCQWYHPTISFSVILFCPKSLAASGSFPMSWLFTSGGQSIGASTLASVLPMNIQGWFPLGLTDLISLQS